MEPLYRVRSPAGMKFVDAAPGEVLLLRADLDAGFMLPADRVAVIAAADLLGSRAGHRIPMEPAHGALEAGSETALRIGDAVIHIEHGIGRLRGTESVAAAGIAEQEALRLEYAGGAMLMVPVSEIDQIWRYGGESDTVSLDRLDGEGWKRRREQVERDIADDRFGGCCFWRASARRPAGAEAEPAGAGATNGSSPASPFAPTVDQARAVARHFGRSEIGASDGPAGLRRCRFRQDRGGAARRRRRRVQRAARSRSSRRPRCWCASI